MLWKNNKKEFKKELFLNYTVMLLPHSQDKPIHFRVPVWVFGSAFLSLFILLAMTLFFSYSSYRLKDVAEQKKLLESELLDLESEKARLAKEKELLAGDNQEIAKENAALAKDQEKQEQELEKLKALSAQTLQELEELYQRESDIREKLGLDSVEADEDEEKDFPEGQSSEGQESSADQVSLAGHNSVLPVSMLNPVTGASVTSAQSLEQNFLFLQNGIQRQEDSYDSMNTEIAEKADENRKEQVRAQIVRYALQFVGNPYVYGGRDPNTGVDCSGFSRYVLSHVAGVSLNSTASSQSQQGTSVSIGAAQPGDLIFYGSGDHVNHVAIYIGDGRVVHASNEKTGITVSNWNYRTPVAIKSVIN